MSEQTTSPVTGLVDAALAHLDGIEERPVGEHVSAYDAVHRGLQDALATLDEA